MYQNGLRITQIPLCRTQGTAQSVQEAQRIPRGKGAYQQTVNLEQQSLFSSEL